MENGQIILLEMTLMFIPNTYVENAKIIALPRHKIANVNNSAPSTTVKWRGELKLRSAISIRARISPCSS